MPKRIVITGPESTGKSALAEALSHHFQAPWVREYAREYLTANGPSYEESDLVIMAKGQEEARKQISSDFHLVIEDTDLLTFLIWGQVVFGKEPEGIRQRWMQNQPDLFLLCDVDLPWSDDPLREHPHRRLELMNAYRLELSKTSTRVVEINGLGGKREERAIRALTSLLEEEAGDEPSEK